MIKTDFVSSVQSNYERIYLSEKPDDNRYQYCMLTRGGIKGLLSCSLRYINGSAYLYYDITSRQTVVQMCKQEMITRKWVIDFFDSLNEMKLELARFLLDEKNLLMYPDHIYRDLSNKRFYFLYVPYNKEENGASTLFEFMLEHMDYEDERLVECIYSMYEQYERLGEIYLKEQIYEDVEKLENAEIAALQEEETLEIETLEAQDTLDIEYSPEVREEKKTFWKRFGDKRKKAEEQKNQYREKMLERMEGLAVAEDVQYEEDYGQTIYMEQPTEEKRVHKLYTPDGRVAAVLEGDELVIGKQKEGVNLVLNDESVSRIHAKICVEEEMVYLADENSRNGTFKNGIRLQPFERRRLQTDDEIRIGNLLFVYR